MVCLPFENTAWECLLIMSSNLQQPPHFSRTETKLRRGDLCCELESNRNKIQESLDLLSSN